MKRIIYMLFCIVLLLAVSCSPSGSGSGSGSTNAGGEGGASSSDAAVYAKTVEEFLTEIYSKLVYADESIIDPVNEKLKAKITFDELQGYSSDSLSADEPLSIERSRTSWDTTKNVDISVNGTINVEDSSVSESGMITYNNVSFTASENTGTAGGWHIHEDGKIADVEVTGTAANAYLGDIALEMIAALAFSIGDESVVASGNLEYSLDYDLSIDYVSGKKVQGDNYSVDFQIAENGTISNISVSIGAEIGDDTANESDVFTIGFDVDPDVDGVGISNVTCTKWDTPYTEFDPNDKSLDVMDMIAEAIYKQINAHYPAW